MRCSLLAPPSTGVSARPFLSPLLPNPSTGVRDGWARSQGSSLPSTPQKREVAAAFVVVDRVPQHGSSLFLTSPAGQQLQTDRQTCGVSQGLYKQPLAAQNLHGALRSQNQGSVRNRSQCAPVSKVASAGAFPPSPPTWQAPFCLKHFTCFVPGSKIKIESFCQVGSPRNPGIAESRTQSFSSGC